MRTSTDYLNLKLKFNNHMFHVSDFLDYDDNWLADKPPIQYDYNAIAPGDSPTLKKAGGRWKGSTFFEGDKIVFADN